MTFVTIGTLFLTTFGRCFAFFLTTFCCKDTLFPTNNRHPKLHFYILLVV